MSEGALWQADEAAQATGGRASGQWSATGVSIDSRSVEPGDLFVALRGPSRDGHAFVGSALKQGAAAAMVTHLPAGLPSTVPHLLVDDTQSALAALARRARARAERVGLVAVTGSVGKTSTKEGLRLALERQGKTFGSPGNLNNHWGAPLSLSRLPADARFAVLELGMNHAGEIGPLSRLARPYVAVVTTVEAVHLEFFESVQGIADAKAELFEGLEDGGIAVLNRDNAFFDRLASAARTRGAGRVLGFGEHPQADVRLLSLTLFAATSHLTADVDGCCVSYKVGAPGRHMALNSLAILAAVKALGADVGLAALALADLSALKGRGRQCEVPVSGGGFTLLDESYNASPASLRASLEVLGRVPIGPRGRRIAVLGDMLELGAAAPELHAELAKQMLENGIDLVFCCGANMAHLAAALPAERLARHAADATALRPAVLASMRNGDAVMVKGSFGMGMASLVEALLALRQPAERLKA
ncbi:MAG: UDP-N-acetylmuramoylalanyl-D-glutamyl-2,6-diaminopimelate--D-alanyl-D-alanine ligase [Alphaproteobacteria bacterium]|nr:UDP-N-acetylmuramoylalanyl-D-glutamyl-2,6-diaminopimelate--D-alanyl-D-alanine ligase [Alphaproteobacteria bacterium]